MEMKMKKVIRILFIIAMIFILILISFGIYYYHYPVKKALHIKMSGYLVSKQTEAGDRLPVEVSLELEKQKFVFGNRETALQGVVKLYSGKQLLGESEFYTHKIQDYMAVEWKDEMDEKASLYALNREMDMCLMGIPSTKLSLPEAFPEQDEEMLLIAASEGGGKEVEEVKAVFMEHSGQVEEWMKTN